jgi:molybdenum cofactor cytidylyltransferase
MGKPKMLLPYGNQSIIETVIQQSKASGVSKTFVVLGAGNEAIGKKIKGLHVEILMNHRYQEGMLSSVQEGIKSLPENTEAVMVLLGDQPMITSGLMDRMIARYKQSEKEIIIASYQGKRGHPILIGSKHFKEVLGFTSDQSLRDLLTRHPDDMEELETENPEILRDIDTEQDYQNELKQQGI